MKRFTPLALKRAQRALEYALLAGMHVFFLIAFRAFYSWAMALVLGLASFGMNFQLTQLRERRRVEARMDPRRLLADTIESILFLLFVVALSLGGVLRSWMAIAYTEYLGYVAAILGGIFIAGLVGEIYWQLRHLRQLDADRMGNYVANLHRTIIFPYLRRRTKQ